MLQTIFCVTMNLLVCHNVGYHGRVAAVTNCTGQSCTEPYFLMEMWQIMILSRHFWDHKWPKQVLDIV